MRRQDVPNERLEIAKEREKSAQLRMEETYCIPLVGTFVFVITMMAIYYLGRQVSGYYAPVVSEEGIEFVEAV